MLAKDSTSWIAFVGFFALAVAIVSFLTGLPSLRYLSYVAFAIFIFLIWFFRDPERTTKICDHCLFSAADGKVIDISNGRVCVFMNVHNVHVNRAPISGTIRSIEHKKGGHIPAFNKDSERNERTITVIGSSHGDVVVTQIAGVLVRRIVSYLHEGDEVFSGQKIGMIKFGSRVDVTVPSNFEIVCKVGDRVYAGETIIAKEKGFRRKSK
ncbi:phosphatidylserine decarboxylase [Methanococcoides sp. FTZ1]|uniref:phosphatidylserine decarboxylase n=1 Tax=Methanococcoides sp. FTZ1 TaxID=3439061 RepID=UPI003F839CBF